MTSPEREKNTGDHGTNGHDDSSDRNESPGSSGNSRIDRNDGLRKSDEQSGTISNGTSSNDESNKRAFEWSTVKRTLLTLSDITIKKVLRSYNTLIN